MFNILLKVVIWIISSLADIIISPIMLIINQIAPDLVVSLDGIFDFLEYMTVKVVFVAKFFMIPSLAFTAMYTVFSVMMVLVGVRIYKFAIKVYNTLKP